MNITITVPEGESNHGNPSLLCVPPQWYDYMVFYLANYFAHVASIISTPGQGPRTTLAVLVPALFFPTSGVIRALLRIHRCAWREADTLKRAARADALCMVMAEHQLPLAPSIARGGGSDASALEAQRVGSIAAASAGGRRYDERAGEPASASHGMELREIGNSSKAEPMLLNQSGVSTAQ